MTERCRSGEREEKTARSAGSYLDRVQWAEGWEEVEGPCMCFTLTPDCNGWAALLTCRTVCFFREQEWRGKRVLVMMLVSWVRHADGAQVALSTLTLSSTSGGPITLQVQVPMKNSHFGKQMHAIVVQQGPYKASQNHGNSLTCPDCKPVGHTGQVVVLPTEQIWRLWF